MPTIVTSQEEYDDAIADPEVTSIQIRMPDGVWVEIGATNTTSVELYSGRVWSLAYGGRIRYVHPGGYIDRIGLGGHVDSVCGGHVRSINDGGRVNSVYNGGRVDSVLCGGKVETVCSGGHIGAVRSGGYVEWVTGTGVVEHVRDGGVVGRVSNGGSVVASGTAVVQAVDAGGRVRAGSHVSVCVYSVRARVEGGRVIDMAALDLDDAAAWAAYHAVPVADGRVTLYKATGDNYVSQHGTVYLPGTEMTCPDWRDDHYCGGGYHLSPTARQATTYRIGTQRWLRCTAAIEDVRPINDLGAEAKAKVRVLRVEAAVDRYGNDLVADGS